MTPWLACDSTYSNYADDLLLVQWDAATHYGTATNTVSTTYSLASTVVSSQHYVLSMEASPARDALEVVAGAVAIPKRALRYALPDGAVLQVDDEGNFRLEDADAKVVYQATRVRAFNPYMNASDLVAKFIEFVAKVGVRRNELATLPLALFINWLIVEAAERDGDPVPEAVVPVPRLLHARLKPRCPSCQRFVPRQRASQGFLYDRPGCAARHAERVLAA